MPTDIESILFVVTRGDSIGGAQIHVRDTATACKSRGLRVAVAVGSEGALTEALGAAGIPWNLVPGLIRSVNPLRDLAAVGELRKTIRAFSPALVSCHTAKAGMVGRIAAFLEGVPSVFTAHGWQFADGIGFAQKAAVLAVEYLCARLSARIIVVSRYDSELARKYRVAGDRTLRLVRNGMPDRPAPLGRLANDARCRLIMTARFQEQKDHETLFQALSGLSDRDWSLTMVGDGPLIEHFKTRATELGLSGRVEFLGQRMDVPELLESADLFVLSTKWEGFPRSILEAMRAGLPVVSSDVGGCSESVADGETGFLVPAGAAEPLRAALRKLMDDPGLRRKMGAAGRARFEREFTFEAMFAATAAVWAEAAARRCHLA